MSEELELSRLRAIVALVREHGLTKLSLADGTVIERPPPTPLELLAQRSPIATTDPDDEDEVEEDAKKEKALERRWSRYWTRMTRSSGADVPSFPGADQAARYLGGRE